MRSRRAVRPRMPRTEAPRPLRARSGAAGAWRLAGPRRRSRFRACSSCRHLATLEVHDLVRDRARARAVRDEQNRGSPIGEDAQVLPQTRLGRRRRGRRSARRARSRWPAPTGDGGSRGRRTPAEPGRPTGPRPARRGRHRDSRSPAIASSSAMPMTSRSGSVSPSATFAAMVPANRPGCCPDHASHRVGERFATSASAYVAVPVQGAAPRSAAKTLDFPAPLRPSITVTVPGRVTSVTGGRAPLAVVNGDVVQHEIAACGTGIAESALAGAATSRAASSTAKTSSVAATPSAAAWNCTPDLAQRQVRLGRQQQHEQADRERQRARRAAGSRSTPR